MYNFYNLNAMHNTSSNDSNGVTLPVNEPLNNETFYKLFSDYYYDNTSEEKQNILAEHINQIDYLIAFTTDDASINTQSLTNITISQTDDLNLLISTTQEREVYLPVFTNQTELKRFTDECVFTLKVPAKWLWKFTLSQNNFSGIVFNPASIGWDISLDHVQSLLDDIKNTK